MAQDLMMALPLDTGQPIAKSVLKVGDGNDGDPDGQLISTLTTGSAPMSITSTTVVSNLNVDQVDGYDASDLFNLDNANVSGVLDIDHGGTNISTYVQGDILYASVANTLAALSLGNNGFVLTSNGTVPVWSSPGAPGAHASTHEEGGVDEIELADMGTAETNTNRVLVPDGTTGVSWAVSELLPTSTEQYAALVADAAGGWVEDTAFNINAGVVYDGTWEADIIDLERGGTEADLSATGPGALVQTAGGSVVSVETLATSRGGTGQNFGATAINSMLYFSAAGVVSALAPGTDNYVLRSNSGVPTWEAEQALPTSTEQFAALVADGSGGWVEDTDFNINTGSVTDGTWTADIIGLTYGGTGANLSATGPGALVQTAGGATVTVETLDEVRGGTGQTTYAAGDILYGTGVNTLGKLSAGTNGDIIKQVGGVPTWSTENLPATGANIGELLYWNGTIWAVLGTGTAGNVLTTQGNGSSPTWTTGGGTMDDWVIDGDAGGPKTLADGETLDIAGEAGVLTTTLAGAGSPFTMTISVDSSGIDTDKIAADAVDNTKIDWGSTGNQVDSNDLPMVTGYTRTNYTVGSSYAGITNELEGIDTALGNLSAGIVFKGPQFSKDQFDDTDGIRAAQWQQFPGQAAVGERFLIYDGTTTETWTAVSGAAAANQFDMSGTRNAMIASLVTRINTDSTLVTAEICNIEGIDGTNNCMTIIGDDTSATIRSYADDGTPGNDWTSTQPNVGSDPMDESDDLTAAPNTQPGATNFSAPIAQATLADAWTYVVRGGSEAGSWFRWDNTDDQWTVIAISPTKGYQGGDGITIDTGTEPDTIEVDLSANAGLQFASGELEVNDGNTLTISGGVLDIDLTNANTWTGLQTFSHASGIQTDDITERTGGHGVEIDSCLIKDGIAEASDVVKDETYDAAAGGVSNWDILYITTGGELALADANTAATGYGAVVGVAETTTGAGTPVPLLQAGNIRVQLIGALAGIDEGVTIYVSKTAGSGTNDVSAYTSNDWIQEVGTIVDPSQYGVDQTVILTWAPKVAILLS